MKATTYRGHDIDRVLRERLHMAGCYPLRAQNGDGEDAGEIWFTPHLNREFMLEARVIDPITANAALRRAGMEEAF
ncbi:MAG TPA: type II toxin-antitoxin system HicA family toxin [Alphaproteobacteria bacterium]|jgi:hypothetical protein